MNKAPLLGITMGDAAGIGPEIIVGAWPDIVRKIPCRPLVYGHPEILRRAATLKKNGVEIRKISSVNELSEATLSPHSTTTLPCLCCGDDGVTGVRPGTVDACAGDAAFKAINAAIDDALAGSIDAVVTAPIHKEALNLAGYHYPGHTEIFAERCGIDDFAMMLYLGPGENLISPHGLAVVHVTLHTAMRTVFDLITADSVAAKAHLADGFMRRVIGKSGARKPRIGVCSLNPHAGENGLFGTEEIDVIRPGIEKAKADGMDIEGPFPADTIMIDAKNGRYDAIVAMFHDQGHIALKLLGMHRAVNITLGLPIIRTSVAHGTAFDRAWQGIAETGSLFEATHVAGKLAEGRNLEE